MLGVVEELPASPLEDAEEEDAPSCCGGDGFMRLFPEEVGRGESLPGEGALLGGEAAPSIAPSTFLFFVLPASPVWVGQDSPPP